MSSTSPQQSTDSEFTGREIIIRGYVQGVGFRPFVYRLAQELKVRGHVKNNAGQVTIIAEASNAQLDLFCEQLISRAPLHAKPLIEKIDCIPPHGFENFTIEQSQLLASSDIHIHADLATCDQCVAELLDKNNRRYLYPFINCTECGPRYSIIHALPYDRANTSMHKFPLCEACTSEYTNPADRRFHAEPVACTDCGPVLNYVDKQQNIRDNQQALHLAIRALQRGEIVAVKSIGGYHLMCDATSETAIARLRERKHRPHKPFAILMTQSELPSYVTVQPHELDLLTQASRPIVLVQRDNNCTLPDILAPGINKLGVMLPGNPLQHLLCHFFNKPMVATSANISGEPLIIDNADATKKLQTLCDAFLHHDRPILRPADDPVVTETQIIRCGRGIAPLEFDLPFTLDKPVLAVGGHLKNTVALAWENRMVMSAHNGDLGSLRSYQTFQQVINDLQQLYQVNAETIICDAHPDYSSSRWAHEQSLPVVPVFHHHAHASSLLLDHPATEHCLVFSWDGIGLGDDGTLWGGETFFGHAGRWQRVYSFRSFRLPGGEKTARDAWRLAASLNWHCDLAYNNPQQDVEALKMLWDKNLNCPQSSAAGRLFSAAAAFTGICDSESFEGHGPMQLEALAETASAAPLKLESIIDDNHVSRIDWHPLVTMLNDTSRSPAQRARCFHETLAKIICDIATQFHEQYRDLSVGFCGGVFQNQLLLNLASDLLKAKNIRFIKPESIPLNDGGLSAGQIIEYYFIPRANS